MAQITKQRYYELRKLIYADELKNELKALPNLPSRGELMAAFQSMENALVAVSFKAGFDSNIKRVTNARLSNLVLAKFLRWKADQLERSK